MYILFLSNSCAWKEGELSSTLLVSKPDFSHVFSISQDICTSSPTLLFFHSHMQKYHYFKVYSTQTYKEIQQPDDEHADL